MLKHYWHRSSKHFSKLFPDLPSSTSDTEVKAVVDRPLVWAERDDSLIRFQTYRLRIEMQHRDSELWYSAEYWSFKVGDELNDKYRLNVSGYSGDAGDALQYEGDWNGNGGFGNYLHNGMMFSTYDQDNDRYDDNCVAERGGGWWFNRCEQCCLTCWWKKHRWDFLPGDRKRIAVSRMMIKPQ